MWTWIARKWASKAASNILVGVVVAVIGLGATAWYKKSSDLAKCQLQFANLETDIIQLRLEREKRRRQADADIRRIHDAGERDIEAIRSTQDACSGSVNPDANLLRDKAANLSGE